MAKVHEEITTELQRFLEKQPLFFVATAPLIGAGHVNLSPKGQDCLRVFSPRCVGYLDLTGSGNETAAHLTENGRITFMFCAFAGAPRILRLYGTGRVVLPDSSEWAVVRQSFPPLPGARQVIMAEIERVQTSCGMGVPLLDYVGERDNLLTWATAKGEDGLAAYREEKNRRSIDGLEAPFI
ncbi:MAG TPA: pyridoxamine 5'-phosphate oxidase family protein [Chloroflexia bacterium]|nr:pyridoxamine 5'-phosphate oxidase family protein [Chloroflexia bacterium]